MQLVRSRASPNQEHRAVRQLEQSGQRSGDELRLVVTSLAQALFVQRYRHHHIRGRNTFLGLHGFRQPPGEPFSQRCKFLELEEHDPTRQAALVDRIAARALKTEAALETRSALQRAPLRRNLLLQWRAADGAALSRQRPK